MKKFKLSVALILAMAAVMPLNSCIGSFALTNKVLSWNRQVGSKFLNEIVFFAFWVLPVYEVTSMADLIVINSIEFWSGTNPMTASVKKVPTDHGDYLIACDGKGYTVTFKPTGESMRLDFLEDSNTWAVNVDGEEYPFMTFIDENHVKMITPDGTFTNVELNERGVLAYQQIASGSSLAATFVK